MTHRFGTVALIGKPNVGKSTLVNAMVGQKVAIVSDKKQTTRRRLRGIATAPDHQIVFVDTPGVHEPHTRLGKAMVESARSALTDVDLVLYVANGAARPDEDEKRIAKMVADSGFGGGKGRLVLCLNKMDLLKPEHVLPNVEAYARLLGVTQDDTMLTTATKGHNLDKLVSMIVERLPEGPPAYPEDEFTDQSSRFMVAELVRERILLKTRQEVPHATGVVVESWEEDDSGRLRIAATIVVERSGQKAILIGEKGRFVHDVGTESRREIEETLGRPVHLDLYVKVREDWRENPTTLREMEYVE
ncbi:MAG: GTPase Era [Fimbriimonadaceae bacterium]|nr:GTPase Era [Fimbriimonadaceae bacterium]